MQFNAVWQKMVMLAGVMAAMTISVPALAVKPSDDNLMCAAYMDIAVEDLYPLKAIPQAKAKQMLSSRFMRLAAASITTKQPASVIASEFIAARDQARADLIKGSQLNVMRLYTESEIYNYAQAIDKKTTQHCLKGNASYEAMAKNYSVKEIVNMSVDVSNELKKRGES